MDRRSFFKFAGGAVVFASPPLPAWTAYTPAVKGCTYTTATGRYRKIGRTVIVEFKILWPIGDASGDTTVSLPGLPKRGSRGRD